LTERSFFVQKIHPVLHRFAFLESLPERPKTPKKQKSSDFRNHQAALFSLKSDALDTFIF